MEWTKVAATSELADGQKKCVDLGDDRQLCVLKTEGEYFAIGAWCSHQKASMALGGVEGGEILCPLHGARFDLRTGKNLSLPAVRPIPVYETKVEGGDLWVKV